MGGCTPVRQKEPLLWHISGCKVSTPVDEENLCVIHNSKVWIITKIQYKGLLKRVLQGRVFSNLMLMVSHDHDTKMSVVNEI